MEDGYILIKIFDVEFSVNKKKGSRQSQHFKSLESCLTSFNLIYIYPNLTNFPYTRAITISMFSKSDW